MGTSSGGLGEGRNWFLKSDCEVCENASTTAYSGANANRGGGDAAGGLTIPQQGQGGPPDRGAFLSKCANNCVASMNFDLLLCARFSGPFLLQCLKASAAKYGVCLVKCGHSAFVPDPARSLCFIGTCFLQKKDTEYPCTMRCTYTCAKFSCEDKLPPRKIGLRDCYRQCPDVKHVCMHYDMTTGSYGMGCPKGAVGWMPKGGGPGNAYIPPIKNYPPSGCGAYSCGRTY